MSYILVIDDSPLIRERVIAALQDEGFTAVESAENGEQALKMIAERRPFAVISDIHMPIMNGLQMLERIKRMDTQLPVLMLTNYTDEAYRERAQKLGADAFFSKSTDLDQLLEWLKKKYPPTLVSH